ncbi:MAG: FecR domain-containing protein [Odoribacter sp.]|nr:FecR domain-containing protein [Odoribacter sp.]MDY3032401.1 FecR domain-containing protein [Odoribacter sp.]
MTFHVYGILSSGVIMETIAMKKIDWHIIRKVFDKTATVSEEKEYEQWLNTSQVHREYAKRIKDFNGSSPKISEEELQQLYRSFSFSMQQRKRLRIVKWSSVAALLFLTLGSGWLLLNLKSESSLPVITEVAATEKYDDVVRMTTADGKVYNLENKKEQVAEGKKVLDVEEAAEMVEPRVIDVPQGKTWQFMLADSSRVYVNANSRLVFPENFDGQQERRIHLEYGEAYFEVTKDAEKPFIVSVGETETTVYGTEFNINGYQPDSPKTTLIQGSVGMKVVGDVKEIRLKPGQQGQLDEAGTLVAKEVDWETLVAWKENIFFFRNAALEEIASRLADWYGVEFRFSRESLKREGFYCRLPRTLPLENVLKALERGRAVRFIYENNIVTVY